MKRIDFIQSIPCCRQPILSCVFSVFICLLLAQHNNQFNPRKLWISLFFIFKMFFKYFFIQFIYFCFCVFNLILQKTLFYFIYLNSHSFEFWISLFFIVSKCSSNTISFNSLLNSYFFAYVPSTWSCEKLYFIIYILTNLNFEFRYSLFSKCVSNTFLFNSVSNSSFCFCVFNMILRKTFLKYLNSHSFKFWISLFFTFKMCFKYLFYSI